MTVARWAQVYQKEYGTLEGFDAGFVSRLWVPGMYAGRAYKNLNVREMMKEMATRGEATT